MPFSPNLIDMLMSPGFTLVEILVVVGVLVALFAISIPVLGLARQRAQVQATRGLVASVTTAVTSYHLELWPVVDASGGVRNYLAWDWNRDQRLDGHPEADEPGITAGSHPHHALWAGGFRDSVGAELPGQFRAANGRVVDAWGAQLRIAWATEAYGATGFGIWSPGPDGLDAPGDPGSDDLVSWRSGP
jgi:type II secretory pathway pseudopilin PulG